MDERTERPEASPSATGDGATAARTSRRRWPLAGTIASAMLAGGAFMALPLMTMYSGHRVMTIARSPGASAADKERAIFDALATFTYIKVALGVGVGSGLVGLGFFLALLKDLRTTKRAGER